LVYQLFEVGIGTLGIVADDVAFPPTVTISIGQRTVSLAYVLQPIFSNCSLLLVLVLSTVRR
jgi:hypothetical protein